MSMCDEATGTDGQAAEDAALAIARRFEEDWPADIEGYLPPGGEVRRLAVIHLSNIDLELRLEAYGVARAEDYLRRFAPEWAADRQAALDLIAAEYEGLGEAPAPEEFCERYPAYRADLLPL